MILFAIISPYFVDLEILFTRIKFLRLYIWIKRSFLKYSSGIDELGALTIQLQESISTNQLIFTLFCISIEVLKRQNVGASLTRLQLSLRLVRLHTADVDMTCLKITRKTYCWKITQYLKTVSKWIWSRFIFYIWMGKFNRVITSNLSNIKLYNQNSICNLKKIKQVIVHFWWKVNRLNKWNLE